MNPKCYKQWLLIGGHSDGHVKIVPPYETILEVPVLKEVSATAWRDGALPSASVEYEVETYVRELLCTKTKTVWLGRHQSLTMEDVLEHLWKNYSFGTKAERERIGTGRTPGLLAGRVVAMQLAEDILTAPEEYELMWVNNGHPDYDAPDPMPALKEMARFYMLHHC